MFGWTEASGAYGRLVTTATERTAQVAGGRPARDWPPRRRGLVLLAASLGFAVIQLDVSVVNVAIKPIGAAFGGGVTGLQWVVDAYTLALASLILTAGALADRLGGKRVFTAGFALFTAASVACCLAPDLGTLIASRAVQGAGAAALGGCSLVLVSHAYPRPPERARAVGLWAAGASAALAAGPVAGGVLIAALGWRAIFFINVPIGAAGIWLTARHAAETPRSRQRGVDLCGQVTAVIALAAFAGATIEAGSQGFTAPAVACGFAVVIVAGALLMAAGCAGLSQAGPAAPYGALAGQLAVTGLGLGILVPAMTSALLGSVDRSRSGVAAGTVNAARQTGSVLGVAAFGTLVTSSGPVPGLHLALIISIGLVLAVAALSILIGKQPARDQNGQP
jgi:Major Facilitator Superfamily